MFQLTIWSLPSLIALILASHTYRVVRRSPSVPGVTALLGLSACVMVWSAGQLFGTLTTTAELKMLGMHLQSPGFFYLCVCWYWFALSYARRQRRVSVTTLVAISIVPTISLALALTNEWHELVWRAPHTIVHSGYVGWVAEVGPWLMFNEIYAYLLLFAGTVILGFELSSSKRYRKALVAVITAPVITSALNVLSLSGWYPVPGFDLTPLGFALSALLMNDSVLRFGLLEVTPAIRNRVVEQLMDGVVVIRRDGRIIDLNPAAAATFGMPIEAALNQPAMDFIQTPLLPGLLVGLFSNAEITVGSRSFHVLATPLSNDAERPQEMALVFRDITELTKIKQEMERLAHTDFLTGLYNRRFFMQRLGEETERVKRGHQPMSVLLLDMDSFKTVNDTHGHDVGDRVLQVIASVTQEVKRISDVSARIGGEEFAMLLPDTDRDGAIKLAQRLRRTINEQIIADAKGGPITVTASIGVATMSHADHGIDHILTHADRALYRAKDAGRNRVCTE
ncbi:MAG TPA: diguanylate cyclase [Pseudomonadales bacterium]|jgi:diguanylate cyclase (GGDEF)-like protein|nr:diguanylate cyclase [Pseudomonadales bacterium]